MARRAPEKPRPPAIEDSERPGHTHRLPRLLLLTLVVICMGLVVSIVLVSVMAVQASRRAEMTDHRLSALEGFIAERGEVRDDQYQTLDERITAAICGLLDGLPAGPVLDPLRATYGCGPGIPLEQLPPEVAQQFSNGIDSVPTPAVKPRATDDARIPATPEADRKAPRTPQETTSAPSPTSASPATPVASDVPTAAPTTTPPLVDLNPITEPVCNLLHVCL